MTGFLKLALVLMFVWAIACSRGVAWQSDVPNEIVVPAGASDLKVNAGGADVYYTLADPHPADELFGHLRDKYHPPDWKQVDELLLFPGRRTSEFPAGWSEYSQDSKIVRMWMGNWRNTDGTTVTYIIRYRWPREQRLDRAAIAEVQAILTRPKQ